MEGMRGSWLVVLACGCQFRSGTAAGDASSADADAAAPGDVLDAPRDGAIAFAPCQPLAPATGNVVPVATTVALIAAIGSASPNDTIELADNTYDLSSGSLIVHTDG